jgi:hypothetical protein
VVLPQLDDEALLFRVSGEAVAVRPDPPRQAHKRHTRKYAEF